MTLFIGTMSASMIEANMMYLDNKLFDSRKENVATKLKLSARTVHIYTRIFEFLDVTKQQKIGRFPCLYPYGYLSLFIPLWISLLVYSPIDITPCLYPYGYHSLFIALWISLLVYTPSTYAQCIVVLFTFSMFSFLVCHSGCPTHTYIQPLSLSLSLSLSLHTYIHTHTLFLSFSLSLSTHTHTLSLSLSLDTHTHNLSLSLSLSLDTHTHTHTYSLSFFFFFSHSHTHSLSRHTHTRTHHTGKEEMRFGMEIADVVLHDRDFMAIWRAVDSDRSGRIDVSEFIAFMEAIRSCSRAGSKLSHSQ